MARHGDQRQPDRPFCGRRGRCGDSTRDAGRGARSSSAAASCWARSASCWCWSWRVTGLLAELIAPYSPTANDFAAMMEAPSWAHLLGTDQFGRDLLSRIIFGARTAMIVGLTSALVGGVAGLVLGVGSAYFGGTTDLILQRVFDVLMAFPLIIMALAVVAIFGTGVQNVIIAITIPLIPRCARVVRSSALAIREIPYVDAARALGFGHLRIILCHMVPNVMAPFLIMVTAFVGQAVLAEASLSYLGLGVQEPVPAWGLMLQGGAEEYAHDGALDRHLSGRGDHACRPGDQPVRRCIARYVGSQVAQEVVALPPDRGGTRNDGKRRLTVCGIETLAL